ncbi:MAG TPA: TIGR03621 family F420-dependent LLM class oxidoreductase [Candidatus Saccharimonadales bacterium]|nr:TIGR03621 family F420-dependent LLM class oxidoreductase [Candidatus Saccharimonadales bacterium]
MRSSSDGRILPSIKPFRFAVTATRAESGDAWRAKARRIEELGYDTLLLTDHITQQLAPIPAMAAALEATTRLRVGSYVFANDYRNPVMLAKEIATLDVLSGGRVEFGLGAGWYQRDYDMLGLPYDPPGKRVSRMIEAVGLIDRLFIEDSVDASGEFYTVHGATVLPKPVQRPRPPLMIGAGGPRMLRFAARHADILALNPRFDANAQPVISDLTRGETERKLTRLRAEAGERLDRVELNIFIVDAGVTDEPRSLFDALATRLKGAAAQVVDSPFFLYGSHADLKRQLLARRERLGITYFGLPEKAMEPFAPLVRELRAL